MGIKYFILTLAFMASIIQLALATATYRNEIEITPAPLEEEITTKKSGFFSGFKNFFRGSSSTTATPPVIADYAPHGSYQSLSEERAYPSTPQGKKAPRPPALAIPQAPLMPLGPRPDTPSSSPWSADAQQPPQFPQGHQLKGATTTTGDSNQQSEQQKYQSQNSFGFNSNVDRQQLKNTQNSFSSDLQFGNSDYGVSGQQQNRPLMPGLAPYRTTPLPSGFELSYGGNQVSPSRGVTRPQLPNEFISTSTATSTSSTTPTTTTPRAINSQPSMRIDVRYNGNNFDINPPISTTTRKPPTQGTDELPLSSNLNPKNSATSSGTVWTTDDEFYKFTEELFSKDVNNQMNLIQVNPQGQTRSVDSYDEAPQPLLQVDPKALESPTIAKMLALFNNYEVDSATNEYVSPNERKEEDEFLDAILSTAVMRYAMLYLQGKGIVTADPKSHRDLLKELWFTQHSRGGGKIGSSGFESVFLHEVNDGTLSGLHNWVYFHEEEKAGRLDYKGFLSQQDLGSRGKVIKVRFSHNGVNKPVNTLFIGTSPELEMALYTVCFKLRPDRTCPVSLGNSKLGVMTLTWRYRGQNLIGRAYPIL